MDELKPCPAPWCDDPEDVQVTGYKGMEFVVCSNCGCTGPEGNSPAEAITAWNTRADEVVARHYEAGRLAGMEQAAVIADMLAETDPSADEEATDWHEAAQTVADHIRAAKGEDNG